MSLTLKRPGKPAITLESDEIMELVAMRALQLAKKHNSSSVMRSAILLALAAAELVEDGTITEEALL